MTKENHSLNQPQSVQTEITKRSIRVTGIEESTEENVYHRKADDMKKLQDVASKLGFPELKVNSVIRAGKFDKQRHRMMIVELTTRSDAELLVSKAMMDKLGTSSDIWTSPDLSKEERLLERKVLKKRRELIDAKTDRKRIKVRNLTLFLDGEAVPV